MIEVKKVAEEWESWDEEEKTARLEAKAKSWYQKSFTNG